MFRRWCCEQTEVKYEVIPASEQSFQPGLLKDSVPPEAGRPGVEGGPGYYAQQQTTLSSWFCSAQRLCMCMVMPIVALIFGAAWADLLLTGSGSPRAAADSADEVYSTVPAAAVQRGSPANASACSPAGAGGRVSSSSGPSSSGWRRLPRTDPVIVTAMMQAIDLLDVYRLRCKPQVSTMTGSECTSWAEDFFVAVPEVVKPFWKHKADCSGFDYKIIYPCGQTQQEVSVSFTIASHRWELLETVPGHCAVTSDNAGSWVEINRKQNDVTSLAQAAVARLQHLRELEGCAKAGTGGLALKAVHLAAGKALPYYSTAMLLEVLHEGGGSALACMTADRSREFKEGKDLEISTGFFGMDRFYACSDHSRWKACLENNAELNHYLRIPDAVDIHEMPDVRNLIANSTVRDLDMGFDATRNSGLGLEVEDPHAEASERLLAENLWLFGPRSSAPHVRPPLKHRWLTRAAAGKLQLPSEYLPHVSGRHRHCFTKHPVLDQGSCGVCYATATVTMMSIRLCMISDSNHIGSEETSFNYAVQEFGQCACSKAASSSHDTRTNCARRSKCDGGNLRGIWDRWLRMHNGRLRRQECYPFTFKCHQSSGVVNPWLGGGSCQRYSHLPKWDRPCHCIRPDDKLHAWEECPQHQDSCSTLPRPDMVYLLSTRAQGLNTAELLDNIKLHILEGGPLYTTVIVPQSFWNFFSRRQKGDVYSDPSTVSTGGHAVVMVGWSRTSLTDRKGLLGHDHEYWVIRNSWGTSWAEDGYANILAGKDIMKIESLLGAAMYGKHKDFAAPSCKWLTRTLGPARSPFGLARYTLDLEIMCSEDATLQVFLQTASKFSSRKTFHKTMSFVCSGSAAGQTCSLSSINLLAAGYGLPGSPSTASLVLRSWDRDGNEAWLPYGVVLDPSIASSRVDKLLQALLGVAGAACWGCSRDAPYPEPGAASSNPWKLANMQGSGSDQAVPTVLTAPACSFFGSEILGRLLGCSLGLYLVCLCAIPFAACLCCCAAGNMLARPRGGSGNVMTMPLR